MMAGLPMSEFFLCSLLSAVESLCSLNWRLLPQQGAGLFWCVQHKTMTSSGEALHVCC